jgi:hypothetical protein
MSIFEDTSGWLKETLGFDGDINVEGNKINYTEDGASIGYNGDTLDLDYKDKFGIDSNNRSYINFDGGTLSNDPEYGPRLDMGGFDGNFTLDKDALSYSPNGFDGIGASASIDKWGDVSLEGDVLKNTQIDKALNQGLDAATQSFDNKVLDNQFTTSADINTSSLGRAALGQGTFDDVIKARIVSNDTDQIGWGMKGPVIGGQDLYSAAGSMYNQVATGLTENKNMPEWYNYLYNKGIKPIMNELADSEDLSSYVSGVQFGDDTNNVQLNNGNASYNYNQGGKSLTLDPYGIDFASPDLSFNSDGAFKYSDGDTSISNNGIQIGDLNLNKGGGFSYGSENNLQLSDEGLKYGPFGKGSTNKNVWQEGDFVDLTLDTNSYFQNHSEAELRAMLSDVFGSL